MTRGEAVHTKITGCRVPLLMTAASGVGDSERRILKPRYISGLKFLGNNAPQFRMRLGKKSVQLKFQIALKILCHLKWKGLAAVD